MDLSEAPTVADPKPGQLWMWAFTVGEGTWPLEVVTEEARNAFAVSSYVMIKRGDKFTVVVTDDPGPAKVPGIDLPMLDGGGYMLSPAQPPKRWHVVMLGGKLVWLDHEMFNQAELLTDV